MGWETRPHSGTRYYTRSKKVGGKVLREYCGGGAGGEAAAQADRAARAAREAERHALLLMRRDAAELRAEWDALGARVALLLRATFLSLGYYEHRGQWRKRRVRTEDPKIPPGPGPAKTGVPGQKQPQDPGKKGGKRERETGGDIPVPEGEAGVGA